MSRSDPEWREFSDDQWARLTEGVGRSQWPTALLDGFRRWGAPFAAISASLAMAPAGVVSSAAMPFREEHTVVRMAMAAALCVSGPVAAQNLLINGGLEGGQGSCAQLTLQSGSTAIPGWVVSGGWSVDWMRSSLACCTPSQGSWYPFEGSWYVDLNGSPNTVSGSAIAQDIATTAGGRYRLSVLAIPNNWGTPVGTVKILRVTAGPVVTDFPLVTVSLQCDQGPQMQRIELEFEATATSSRIELRSMFPNSGGGIYVDAVEVVPLPCPVDIDDSGTVNAIDLAIVLSNWGIPSPKYPRADVNADGLVDAIDLAEVLAGWGDCP